MKTNQFNPKHKSTLVAQLSYPVLLPLTSFFVSALVLPAFAKKHNSHKPLLSSLESSQSEKGLTNTQGNRPLLAQADDGFDESDFEDDLQPPSPVMSSSSSSPSKITSRSSTINRDTPVNQVPAGKELVSIDFPNGAALNDIIKTVSVWTGKNFILSGGVAGSARISIIAPEPVTTEEAYQAFLSALNIAGFTTVETGKSVKIMPLQVARSSNIKTYYGANWAPATDELITQIIPLNYTDVNSIKAQLGQVLGQANVSSFTSTNSLIISDTGNRIKRILELIKLLDTKINQPQVTIKQVKNVDVRDAANKIKDIFGGASGGSSFYLQKVSIDERTNSLILVGPPRGLDDVVRFVDRLDKMSEDRDNQSQYRIKTLRYAEAAKLAPTLQAITQSRKQNNFRGFPGAQDGGFGTADLSNVTIAFDQPTNSLIIQANKSAYSELESIIRQLDRRRAQVYVEADIIDVNVTNGFDWKSSFVGASKEGKASVPFGFRATSVLPFVVNPTAETVGTGLLNGGTESAVVGILGDKPIKIAGISLSPGAFIFAVKTDANSNVLQTPSVMVADNEQADFTVNETVKGVQTSTDTQTKVNTQSLQTIAEIVTQLNITPQISEADFINMKIEMQLDNGGTKNSETKTYEQIFKRKAKTALSVKNHKTTVISGLTSESERKSESKVPLLGDIPVLSFLFKNTSRSKQKSNVMVFITPHIVRDSKDLAEVYEKKIQDRDEFLKAFYGKNFKDDEFYEKVNNRGQNRIFSSKPAVPDDVDEVSTSNYTPDNIKHSEMDIPSKEHDPITAPSSAPAAFSSPEPIVSPAAQPQAESNNNTPPPF